jgi:uncharacterized protein
MIKDSYFIVKNSSIQGKGVFASKAIKKNEIVHIMNGMEVSKFKCLYLIITNKIQVDMPLQVSKNNYILLDELSITFNHCCDPTCAIVDKNSLVTIKDIKEGEEITYDYSMTVIPTYYTKYWKMPCNCESNNCRKLISDVISIHKEQLIKYINENKMQTFIREDLKKNHFNLE